MNSSIPISHRITRLFELPDGADPYTEIENLGDGRGYTCGWAGFTTADEEVVACVGKYTAKVGVNHLSGAIQAQLRFLQSQGSNDVKELNDLDFKTHWANAASTPEFQQAYEEVVHERFGLPAQSHCNVLKLKSEVAKAVLFDTVIQHGDDGDPDSTGAIIERTQDRHGHHLEEEKFLLAFLLERRKILLKPANEDSIEEWGKSVGRTYALEHLVIHNPTLQIPVRIETEEYDEKIC